MPFSNETPQSRDKHWSALYLCQFNLIQYPIKVNIQQIFFFYFISFSQYAFKDSYAILYLSIVYFFPLLNSGSLYHHLFIHYSNDSHLGYFHSEVLLFKLLLIFSFFFFCMLSYICIYIFYFFGRCMNYFLVICFQSGCLSLNSH